MGKTLLTPGRLLLHGAGPAGQNMAVDEALLLHSPVPVLRFYSWNAPVVSLGFFQSANVAPRDRAFVRRPTGGGLVDHASDFTYTLVVPKAHAWADLSLEESYRRVHEAVVQALRDNGVEAALTPCCDPDPRDACFERAVKHDVVQGSTKLAGAAQRRMRQGLLHQGSISLHLPGLAQALQTVLGNSMEIDWVPDELSPLEREGTEELVRTKYATREWNEWK